MNDELNTNLPSNPILGAMDKLAERTITIRPNYAAMFQQFKRDAMLHLERMCRRDGKTLTRKEVYDFIASLRIALCSATTVDEVVELRTEFDAGAEKMFAVLMAEQEADESNQQ